LATGSENGRWKGENHHHKPVKTNYKRIEKPGSAPLTGAALEAEAQARAQAHPIGPEAPGTVAKRPLRGAGDLVERVVKPLAKLFGNKCLDEQGRLKPGSPCAQRRDKLNEWRAFKKNSP
jgi:hypothetical protein